MNEIAIVGAGAWGSALAIQAARAGNRVTLWSRSMAAGLVPDRPAGPALPASVELTGNLPIQADAILVAIPMQQLRDVLARMRPKAPLLLCCKGLETGRNLLPLEVAAELHPAIPSAVLTGPNFAGEIAAGLPAATLVAAHNPALRARLTALLASPTFRVYGSADPVGAQFGGAAKNVIAIAAGAVIGAGHGENARAALVTRGLAEIARLIEAEGGRAETAGGLSGMGDLLLTCTGAASRNYAYGVALGRGEAPPPGLAEGVPTAAALVARAADLDLPICRAVADLLSGAVSLRGAVERLLGRRLREEG